MAKAQPNESGVRWADSLSGRLSIAVGRNGIARDWHVWALYKGTHDLAPHTRHFANDQAAAEAYANNLWRNG